MFKSLMNFVLLIGLLLFSISMTSARYVPYGGYLRGGHYRGDYYKGPRGYYRGGYYKGGYLRAGRKYLRNHRGIPLRHYYRGGYW